jgi:hypothetical protein
VPEPQQHPEGGIVSLLPINKPLGFATKGNIYTQPVLIRAENWWPGTYNLGSLEVVSGFARIGPDPGGAGNLTMVAYGEKSSTQTRRYFCSTNTSTYIITTNGTATEVKTGLTADTKHTVVSFGDKVLFFPYDGTTPYKHDFTSVTASSFSDIGLTQPDVTSSLSVTNGDGGVKGVVKYFCAFMSGTTMLALSEAFGEIDAGDGSTIDLSSIPTDSNQNRWIFRTRENGEQPYFVGSIDDGTTTTFSDEKADFDLGFPPPVHGQPPPDGTKYAVVYNNRVYAAGSNEKDLIYSDINKPESFNLFSVYQVGGKDGDQISGLAKIRGAVLVFKKNHLYKVAGQDPEVDMIGVDSVRSDDPESRAIGCPDQKALCGTPDGIFFYYNRNFYMLSNQCTVTPLSQHFEDELRDDINQSKEENIVCEYDPNRKIVYASVPISSSTYPKRTYLYFVELGAWYRMSKGFTDLAVVEVGSDGNPPDSYQLWGHYNADSPLRLVQHLDQPSLNTFDGDAIVADASFPPIRFGRPGDISEFVRGRVTFDVETTSTDLQIRYNLYSRSASAIQIDVDLTKSGGFDRWTRSFGLGYQANEINIQVWWPGGDARPVVHGLDIIGHIASTEFAQ